MGGEAVRIPHTWAVVEQHGHQGGDQLVVASFPTQGSINIQWKFWFKFFLLKMFSFSTWKIVVWHCSKNVKNVIAFKLQFLLYLFWILYISFYLLYLVIFFLGLKLGHTLDTNLWGVGVWDSCLRNQQLRRPLSSIFFFSWSSTILF